jgi:hypothetical protein
MWWLVVPWCTEPCADGVHCHASPQIQQLEGQLAQGVQERAEEGRDRAAAHSSELAGVRANMQGTIDGLQSELASAKEGHARQEATMCDQHKVRARAGPLLVGVCIAGICAYCYNLAPIFGQPLWQPRRCKATATAARASAFRTGTFTP